MKNFIQNGNAFNTVLTADTVGGDVVVMANVAGVALRSGKIGEEIAVSMTGVYSLDKVAATAIPQGTRVFWKADTAEVVTAATGNVQLGYAAAAAAADAPTVNVNLIPA